MSLHPPVRAVGAPRGRSAGRPPGEDRRRQSMAVREGGRGVRASSGAAPCTLVFCFFFRFVRVLKVCRHSRFFRLLTVCRHSRFSVFVYLQWVVHRLFTSFDRVLLGCFLTGVS